AYASGKKDSPLCDVAEFEKNNLKIIPYEMLQELRSMFEKQDGVERFDLIQTFHACKQEEGKSVAAYALHMKGYAKKKSLKAKDKGKANGKGNDKQVYISNPKNPKPYAKEHPAKDDACHHYKEVGHWKRNCPVYLAELLKKKKQVALPVLQCFTDYEILVSENNVFYFNAIPSNGYVHQLERLGYVLPQDIIVGLILNDLTKDFAGFMRNYNMHNMRKTIGELHAMLIEYENSLPKKAEILKVMMIKGGKILKDKKKSLKAKDKEHPAKDDAYHHYKEVGHWKRNCPVYLAELLKKKKQVSSASSSGFREARKLKQGVLYLYVGNGVRAQVEEIGSFDLVFPNGLVICLDNCHYAPSITRGKMTRKSFSHRLERATDLLGIIHTNVCGLLRHVSRQGASYFITFTDDYSRYGYIYILKHKHEVFEMFKAFKNEVEKSTRDDN
nr:hypothetical protein [Tanacetum cinerariifolium]